MKVIDIVNHGKNNKLILTEKAVPAPNEGEILIEVQASGVNRPDILQRYGLHPPPKGSPDHPGLEVSGIIKEVGSGVKKFKEGDKVIALLGVVAMLSIVWQTKNLPYQCQKIYRL